MTVAEALAGSAGPVVIRYRFEQRTKTNAFVALLPDDVWTGGSIELDNDQPIPRSCNLTLRTAELPSTFDTLTSLIAVFGEVLVDGAFVSFQLGLFRLTNPQTGKEPSLDDTVNFIGSDVTYFLEKDKVAGPAEVPAGSNYIGTVESILDGLGLVHDLPASLEETPFDFTWEQGTSSLTIVNHLLKGISHFQIAPDAGGVFRTSPRVPPRAMPPNVEYTTEEEPRLIVPPFQELQSEATIPNLVLAGIQDPNRPLAFASATNNDPTSPLSTVQTETTYAEITMDRVLDVATLLEIAEYELLLASGVANGAVFRTVTDLRRGSNEIYRLTIEGSEVDSLWRVRGWSMPLQVGVPMRHVLQRVQDFVVTFSS